MITNLISKKNGNRNQLKRVTSEGMFSGSKFQIFVINFFFIVIYAKLVM